MEWSEEGIVLAARRHGETSAIVTVLTRGHGVHAGLVRGGAGRRQRGVLQPGNRIAARWRARLAEHLGTYTCELTHALAAEVMDDALKLAALSAACAMAESTLPERESHGAVYDAFAVLLGALGGDDWPTVYVKWELGLLAELGFGLDLGRCAATGQGDDLAYVSPKSGRAVSLGAGAPYRDRLLALPGFLLRPGAVGDAAEVADGLRLTGYFLERHVYHRRGLPAARRRLAERLGGGDLA